MAENLGVSEETMRKVQAEIDRHRGKEIPGRSSNELPDELLNNMSFMSAEAVRAKQIQEVWRT